MSNLKNHQPTSLLALDVGEKRVGLAIARSDIKIPRVLTTLENNADFQSRIKEIIDENEVSLIVVGLPKDLKNENTEQTNFTLEFIQKIKQLGVKIVTQDEALTSVKAEEILKMHPESYNKEDIDALSALIILEDYINEAKI